MSFGHTVCYRKLVFRFRWTGRERENLHTLTHAFVINFRGTLEGQCILWAWVLVSQSHDHGQLTLPIIVRVTEVMPVRVMSICCNIHLSDASFICTYHVGTLWHYIYINTWFVRVFDLQLLLCWSECFVTWSITFLPL